MNQMLSQLSAERVGCTAQTGRLPGICMKAIALLEGICTATEALHVLAAHVPPDGGVLMTLVV
jgi:hypothetical protein